MQVSRVELARLISRYAPDLQAPASIDKVRLLAALAWNESSFGADTKPKHEREYCAWHVDQRPGRYAKDARQAALFHEYGCLACCSFGPMQIMAVNALGFSPFDLLTGAEAAVMASVAFINREIFGRQKAQTIEQVADAYNTGNWHDANIPADYIARFVKHYAIGIPRAAGA